MYLGALETCNEVDDDCDGEVDEDATDAETFYVDADNDGHYDLDTTVEACSAPSGATATPGDCDDTVFEVKPGAPRPATTSTTTATTSSTTTRRRAHLYADRDGDGFGDADTPIEACEQPTDAVDDDQDCDDTDEAVFPGAVEVCNEVDDDCDGTTDGWWYPATSPPSKGHRGSQCASWCA